MSTALTFELEAALNQALGVLNTKTRRRLLSNISRALRASQSSRIGRQQAPDGSGYAPGKKKNSRHRESISFGYRTGRYRRTLKNWRPAGGVGAKAITGYDVDAGAVRTFARDRIDRFFGISTRAVTVSRRKPAKMFTRLRQMRFLKAAVLGDTAVVGFVGRAAAIARAHQFREPVDGHRQAMPPQRTLLGLSDYDRRIVSDLMVTALTQGGQ